MAYTLQQLTILETAIAQGATKVKYADKEVEYRSLAEMQQIRIQMRDELELNGTNPNKSRRRFGTFSKGLN